MAKVRSKPIKTIAGEVLIYLYNRQRQESFTLKNLMLRFSDALDGGAMEGSGEFERVLLHAANGSHDDAYNALDYLRMCSFIEFDASSDSDGVSLINFHVTSEGIDIIEGIERGAVAKQEFNVTFNFKLAENVNIDSLIKNEVDSLIKASLL